MTIQKYLCSKKSIKETVLQSKYMMILHLVVLFLASAFSSITIYNEYLGNMTELQYRSWGKIEEFLSMTGAVGMIASTAVGFVTAYLMFSFLFNKNSVIFYHSMPYKRSNIFLSRYISGIITIAIPLLIEFAINTVIYMYFKNSPPVAKGELCAYSTIVKGFLLAFLQYVVVFSAGAFAASISGNIFAMAGITAFVFLVAPVTAAVVEACIDEWFITYNLNIVYNPFKIFPPAMSLVFLRNEVMTSDIVYAIIFSIAITLIGLVLYIYRKSENTNKFFAYKCIGTILKYYITTIVTLGFGLVFIAASNNNVIITFIGYILVSFIVYAVIQAVFDMNFRQMFKNLKSYALYAVIFIAIISIPALDVFGLDTSIPDRDKINTIYVTKLINADKPQDYGNTLAKLEQQSNIDAVYEFMTNTIGYTHETYKNHSYPDDSLVMNVKINDGGIFNVERRFLYTRKDDRDALVKKLFENAEYRTQFTEAIEEVSWMVVSKGNINASKDTMSEAQMKKLKELLKKDIANTTYEDAKNASMFAELYLNYANVSPTGISNIYHQNHIPVMSCYRETVGFISELLELDKWKENVQMILIGETGQQITDKAQISELIDRSASGGIELRMYTSEYDFTCMWIEKNNLPDFVHPIEK